jgi:hypothetical protein
MVRCIRGMLRVATALVFAMPSVARAEGSCNDCCKYACIEARRLLEDGMQKTYAALAARGKALTAAQFDDEVSKAKTRLAQEEEARVGALPACAWDFPKRGSVDSMKWRSLGWSIQDMGGGRMAYGINVETNMKDCSVRDDQIAILRKIAPCTGFADATTEHENTHVAQCKKRGAGVDVSPSVHAQDEVAGTAAGVKKLTALRDGAQQSCNVKSCPNKSANDIADQLKQDLPQLKKAKGGK